MIACRTAATPKIEIALETGFVLNHPLEGQNTTVNLTRRCLTMRVRPSGQNTNSMCLPIPDSVPVIGRETLEITNASGQRAGRFIMSGGLLEDPETAEPEWVAMVSQARQLFTRHEHPFLGVIGAQPISSLWEGVRHMAFYNFLPAAMPRYSPKRGQMLDQTGWNLASVLATLARRNHGLSSG